MSESPRTVFILEDEPATRQQLERAIEKDPGLTLAASAACLEEAVAWWKAGGRASAALIDLALPDGNGESFIRMIGAAPDAPAILVSTVFGDEKHVVEAIAAGATGYLLKERAASHIAESIHTVLEGGSPISPSIARHLLKRFQQSLPDQTEAPQLTGREEEVLKLVVKGFSYREIADSLELSVHTVTSHIQHIYRKLSVRSRGEAVFEAIQMGLVDLH